MSDDGVQIKCIAIRGQTTIESDPALLTVFPAPNGPIWSTVPDDIFDGRDGTHSIDLNPYVTSSGGSLNGWLTQGGGSFPEDNGILEFAGGSPNNWNVTVFVTDDNGTSPSNEFNVERRNVATITQHPSDLVVTEPEGGVFTVEATHSQGELFPIWQAHDGDGSWGPAGDVLNTVPASETTFQLELASTEEAHDGYQVRCVVRAYEANNNYRIDTNPADLTVNTASDWVYQWTGADRAISETFTATDEPFEVQFDVWIGDFVSTTRLVAVGTNFNTGNPPNLCRFVTSSSGGGELLQFYAWDDAGIQTVRTVDIPYYEEWMTVIGGWDGENLYITVGEDTDSRPMPVISDDYPDVSVRATDTNSAGYFRVRNISFTQGARSHFFPCGEGEGLVFTDTTGDLTGTLTSTNIHYDTAQASPDEGVIPE